MTWILILFAHVGAMGTGNSNALAVVPGFTSEQECRTAGIAAKGMSLNTVKEITYVCVKQSKEKQ